MKLVYLFSGALYIEINKKNVLLHWFFFQVFTRTSESTEHGFWTSCNGQTFKNLFFFQKILIKRTNFKCEQCLVCMSRGRIFSRVRPFYEWAVRDLDRPMHRSLWVYVTHSLLIEGSHTTNNTTSALLNFVFLCRTVFKTIVNISL